MTKALDILQFWYTAAADRFNLSSNQNLGHRQYLKLKTMGLIQHDRYLNETFPNTPTV